MKLGRVETLAQPSTTTAITMKTFKRLKFVSETILLLFFKFLVYSYLFELEGRSELENDLFESGFELLDFGFIDDFILKNVNKIITENLTCSETELKERIRVGCFPDYLNLFKN